MLALIIFILVTDAQGEDPCKGMTVADCEVGDDNIINRYNYKAALCESSCKKSDHCQFWRAYQNESMQLPECLHLRTDYHQDCMSFAGPIDGDIDSCLNTDLSTCSAYIRGECRYTGERMPEGIEPPVGDISSITECQELAKDIKTQMPSLGAEFFHFSGVTEECQIFTTMYSSCNSIGGPETAPPLEECEVGPCGFVQIVSSTSYKCPGGPEQSDNDYCSVFPASNILSLDDDDYWEGSTLVDGLWVGGTANYWLAENHKVGEEQGFIVNLGCSKTVSGVSLKNTHNAHHHDRSTKKFRLRGSATANGPWTELLVANLDDSRQQNPPPLQHLMFPKSTVVSFIKFELLEIYGTAGGGLQYLAVI